MPRATTIAKIEHEIEALSPADQLKLMEWLAKHLKRILAGQPVIQQEFSEKKIISSKGSLSRYANLALRQLESDAFAQAMKEKHATR